MTVVGFDFGTTNSLVSVVQGDAVYDLLDDRGLPEPSVVRYEGNQVVVGRAAREALDAVGPGVHGSFVRSPKTYLGDEAIVVGGRELSPVEVVHDVIDHVKRCALDSSRNAGRLEDITDAVATIPVDLNGPGRRKLREAYARAGIRIVQFVHEPFAALYGHARPRLGTDFLQRYNRKNILVVDWGGGTLDLTLCRIENGRVTQLCNNGTDQVGGDAVDEALRNWVLDRAEADLHEIDPERRRQLRNRCEDTKIILSTEAESSLYLRGFFESGAPLACSMSRADLEEVAKPFIDDAMGRIAALLDTARLGEAQVALCLVTGGMSRMPAIAARLREFFSAHRVEVSDNSATLIAQGAAWIAHDKRQLELAKNVEIQLARGTYHTVVKAGTAIPFAEEHATQSEEGTLQLFCVDPRDGHAKFQLCTPQRPGSEVQQSEPRSEIGRLSLSVDSKAKPFAEQLTLLAALDRDGILRTTVSSSNPKRTDSTAIHSLEFGITLGAANQRKSTVAQGDSYRDPREPDPPEPGALMVRSNIAYADPAFPSKKDHTLVPGDLLFTTQRALFMRGLANGATPMQEYERLYYEPCAVCKRRSNDPACRCGS